MFDTFPLIRDLNLDYIDEEGYASLRCQWLMCPDGWLIKPELDHEDSVVERQGLYAAAWTQFFPNASVPERVTAPYGAQFAVTRDVVRRWPIDKYEQIRQWLWNTDDDYKAGLVLEAMWHVLFGKEAVFCPSPRECYCKKWGYCDLECEDSGWCLGRVWTNPNRNPPMSIAPHLPVSLVLRLFLIPCSRWVSGMLTYDLGRLARGRPELERRSWRRVVPVRWVVAGSRRGKRPLISAL
jgi:hypothetical protein